ncbi:MAG: nucleotidyltransferase domain-containing protein [Gemmatimonadota bacterium]
MGTDTSQSAAATLLFGHTRRDVLALLFGRPDERFYFREILRAAGGGSGGVQRELKQLVEVGLLHRVQEGRLVYFSANRDAPIFAELQSIVQKTAGAVDILRGALVPLIRSDRIIVALVYGSVAKGSQTARSDIDLLLLGEATLSEVVPLLRSAELRLAREVNPSVYPVAEFRKKVRARASFLTQIIAGQKLFIAGDERELGRLAGEPMDRGA